MKEKAEGEGKMIVSVAEAAKQMGVSERTVYRMLKSGELRRETPLRKLQETRTHLAISAENKNKIDVSILSKNDDKKVLNEIQDTLTALQNSLKEKDEQISKLIQSHLEMQQSAQKFQEQIVEIVALVMSKTRPDNSQTGVTKTDTKKPEPETLFARLLRSRKPP